MKVVANIPVGKSPHGVFMLKSPPDAPAGPITPASASAAMPGRALSTAPSNR